MKRNKGLTLIVFIVVIALIGFVGIVAFRSIPIYSEFFTIKRILKQINVDSADTTPQQIRNQFEDLRLGRYVQGGGGFVGDQHASADYVYEVKSRDLDISKENGRILISVSYQKTVPLFYNVSLMFDFEATNRK